MKQTLLFSAIALAFLASACKDKAKDVKVAEPNEAITTVIFTATPTSGGAAVSAKWTQKYGADGNPIGAPDTLKALLELKPNTTYSGVLTLLDSTKTPPLLVSDEVKEEGVEHLVFYQPTPATQPLVIPNTPNAAGSSLHLTISPTDKDASVAQFPIGLETTLTAGATSLGHLRVVLRHQPDVKNGTYAPGSTDADVTFRVQIQP
jgi:hypothetical protein